ncbi:dUTP diphosphatase [Gemmatimonadota bacterium]
MNEPLRVRFLRLESNPDLPLPGRATAHSAGYDVRSSDADFQLRPGEILGVGTGLVMELPLGVECQVRPRSGLAARHGITLLNSPGTIDPDYRGELKVLLQNGGPEAVTIRRGDRIAQLVFSRFETPDIQEVSALSDTTRGEGGFGSTGKT